MSMSPKKIKRESSMRLLIDILLLLITIPYHEERMQNEGALFQYQKQEIQHQNVKGNEKTLIK